MVITEGGWEEDGEVLKVVVTEVEEDVPGAFRQVEILTDEEVEEAVRVGPASVPEGVPCDRRK